MKLIENLISEGNKIVKAYKEKNHAEKYSSLSGEEYETWMGKIAIFAEGLPDGTIKKELEVLYRKRNNYLDAVGAEKTLGVLKAIKCMGKGEDRKLKIFISHSSKDKEYGDVLLELLKGLGLKREEVIYTSNDLYGVPLGKKIYNYLRENIDIEVHMFFLLSANYFKSIACLNEMGAAWLAQKEHTVIGIPEFDFNSKEFRDCCIDSSEMGMLMDNYLRITELKGIVEREFGKRVDDMEWQSLLETYKNNIEKIKGK